MALKPRSLIALKQQQWARERAEELNNYGGIWGRFSDAAEPRHRPCIRGINRSTTDIKTLSDRTPPLIRKRTPSLPPLHSNSYEVQSPPEDDSGGGDTSGYASDSAEFVMTEPPWKPNNNWHQQVAYGPRRTPESFSSGSGGGREERAKWGERGVGVGHLWSPSVHLPANLLPQIEPTAPSWIQRGLQEPAQVLVISHDESLPGSLANSHDMSRSTDTLISDEYHRCFLRGQNAPIDPQIALEKERKRQKAIEHQNAIKQQLEEKERKKRIEQEREKVEEIMEDERLRRHHELEVKRLEDEKRRQMEKEEKDERVAKALREAIEIAERKAKEEKARARRKHVAARRTPTPTPPAHSHSLTNEKQGICSIASRKTPTLPEERVKVIDHTTDPVQNKNEIMVYHAEVMVITPQPLGMTDVMSNRGSPVPFTNIPPVSSPTTKSSRPGSRRRERKSPKSRRSPEVRLPSLSNESKRDEITHERELKATQRFIKAESYDSVAESAKQEEELQLIPERLIDQAVPSSEARETNEDNNKRSDPADNSGKKEKTNDRVDRAISPVILPQSASQLSASPSQDPPPPPRKKLGDKEPPSDAPGNSSYLNASFRLLGTPPPPMELRNEHGASEFEEFLTVAVQDISIDESEIESNRLWIIPSPTPGRLLTPTSQRSGPSRTEVATQTETRASRPTRRVQRLEDRPKWGVNRPSMRYIKASDRYPFSRTRNNDTDDSRSPSPMNKSNSYSNFLPTSRRKRYSSTDSSKTQKESKGINTPRIIHVLPKAGIVRKNSAGRRYLSFKGPKLLNRPPGTSVLPKKFDLTELLTVKDVLSQLTSLKYGLKMKQKEWDVSRSPTPFSEVSSIG